MWVLLLQLSFDFHLQGISFFHPAIFTLYCQLPSILYSDFLSFYLTSIFLFQNPIQGTTIHLVATLIGFLHMTVFLLTITAINWIDFVPLKNLYVEALVPSVWEDVGDGALGGIRFRWGSRTWPLMVESVFSKEAMPESLHSVFRHPHPALMRVQWEGSCSASQNRISPELYHFGTLISEL